LLMHTKTKSKFKMDTVVKFFYLFQIFSVTILYTFSISKALTIHRTVRAAQQFQNFERSHCSLKSSQSTSGNFLGNFFKSAPVKKTTGKTSIAVSTFDSSIGI